MKAIRAGAAAARRAGGAAERRELGSGQQNRRRWVWAAGSSGCSGSAREDALVFLAQLCGNLLSQLLTFDGLYGCSHDGWVPSVGRIGINDYKHSANADPSRDHFG
jgi:hypothetical protein